MLDAQYIQSKITKTKLLIDAYEDAILALGAANGVQHYRLDTGQTVQVVTRADLIDLERMLESLYNRLEVFCSRLKNSRIAVPIW